MTSIRISTTPKIARASIVAPPSESETTGRYCFFEGEVEVSGTYKNQSLHIHNAGSPIRIPDLVAIRITSAYGIARSGTVTYLDSYEIAEMGLKESACLYVEMALEPEEFEYISQMIPVVELCQIRVSASFTAPKIDVSGYLVDWDIAQIGGLKSIHLPVNTLSVDFSARGSRHET